jgi:hypothetical protein
MIENFEAYIDSIGPLSDEELFEDIDETMARKEYKDILCSEKESER